MNYIDKIFIPIHLKALHKWFGSKKLSLLDVGCAGSGVHKALKYLPNCSYYGLDYTKNGLSSEDINLMAKFYEINLEQSELEEIPKDFFDAILVSHVLEHIETSEVIVNKLAEKLQIGGVIYIEFPNFHSLSVPSSQRDYLHFCDDPTHKYVHSARNISNILLRNGCRIIHAGTRKDLVRVILSPLFFLRGILNGDPWNRTMYDFFGCVDSIFAIRIK